MQYSPRPAPKEPKEESLDRQNDLLQKSRNSSSPHHHARLAIALQRQGATTTEEGQWDAMDLGGMHIRALSPVIFQYSFLTAIYLNHNNLTELSKEISLLSNLKYLDVSGNNLTSVPHQLGLIGTLVTLLLFDNDLTSIPFELGFLYQLETLGIQGNPVAMQEPFQNKTTSTVIKYLRDNCPVSAPPPEREWVSFEDEAEDSFTMLCYNTLCDKYATPSSYAYTPSWVLSWEYRKDLILQEILNYNADIVTLQEVEFSQYEEYFREALKTHGEYDSMFYPKSRARTMDEHSRRSVDGCATFWKINKFSLVDKHLLEFQQIAMQRPELKKSEDVYNRVMIKDNIAVVTLLESKDNNQKLVVVNAHLHWDPQYRDVKLVQTAMMIEEVTVITKKWSKSKLPMLVAGDFNSLPGSGVYEFLSIGQIPQTHPDFQSYKYGSYTTSGLSHPFNLKSSYKHIDELHFTNFTPGFKGVIDYIWFSADLITVGGLLANVDEEYAEKCVGFPNWHHPSDHIPLVVSFVWKGSTKRSVNFKS